MRFRTICRCGGVCRRIAVDRCRARAGCRNREGHRALPPDAEGRPLEQSGLARLRSRRSVVDDAARPEERLRSSNAISARGRARLRARSPNCRAISRMPTASWTSETRILWCMEQAAGLQRAPISSKRPHPGGGQPVKELGAIATWVANQSIGQKFAAKLDQPKEKEVVALGEDLFYPPLRVRSISPARPATRPRACASGCRAAVSCPSRRRRARSIGEWPAYRVSIDARDDDAAPHV